MGLFFQNQILARSKDIDRLCRYVLKDPLAKLYTAKYLSIVISRSRVMTNWKQHDVNLAMSSWVAKLREAAELFDYMY